MLYLCIPYFFNSYRSGEVSSNAGGLLIWPAKGLILLGFISLGFQWLSELIKRVAIMNGQLVDEDGRRPHASKPRPSVCIAEMAIPIPLHRRRRLRATASADRAPRPV